ncbi:Rtt106-domain-containing protein [Backusella circina FSU 941]|nr:Rtt106-domain-containing protein [Backusella circina FSU 941]
MTDWLTDSITDPNLRQSVQDVIKSHPSTQGVFKRLVNYFETKSSAQEGDAKRRKLADTTDASSNALLKDEVLRIKDISFQLPARKKYDIIFTSSHLLLFNSKTSQVEHAFNDLTSGCCVPSPDRPAFSFVLYSQNTQQDAIVFSILEKGDITTSNGTISGHTSICELLTKHIRIEISQPSKEIFKASGVSDTTGKPTNRAHVDAYLKAKDGSLYFLPKGILFGFKKPALFFPITSLSSIVITSVTQRTFDLTLILNEGSPVVLGANGFKPTREGNHDTVQFSMISQSEYSGIDHYIKQANINDNSMAEERKATIVNNKQDNDGDDDKNGNKKGDAEDDDSEQDDDFEPSDDDHDPLEYETDAEEEEETERDLEAEERHEYEDAEMDDEEEVDLLDESD